MILQRQAGLSSLGALATTLVVLVLAVVLLDRLAYYQEMAERLHMESTVRALTTGLQIRQAELVFAGHDGEIRQMEGMDPFVLLEPVPADYLGACDKMPRSAPGWCFDEVRGAVIYRPRLQRYLEGPLPTFRVVCQGGQGKTGIIPVRASLQLLYSYHWLGSARAAGRW